MNDNTIVIAGMQEAEALRFSLILGVSAIVMAFILAVLLIVSLIKIRKLNVAKIKENRTMYQVVNIVVPIGIVILGGVVIMFVRKNRYKKK